MFGPHRGPLPNLKKITFKHTQLKQSKGFKGYPKVEHKKTTNRTTMGQTTDIESQAPTVWNRLRKHYENTPIQIYRKKSPPKKKKLKIFR